MQKALNELEQYKCKNNPKNLATVVAIEANRLQKESDNLKKKFIKNEIGVD